MKVKQERIINSTLSLQEVASKICSDNFLRATRLHIDDNQLKLKTSYIWKSFGEIIDIKSKAVSNGKFQYQIISSPRLKTTMFDFGKNFINMKKIESLLT